MDSRRFSNCTLRTGAHTYTRTCARTHTHNHTHTHAHSGSVSFDAYPRAWKLWSEAMSHASTAILLSTGVLPSAWFVPVVEMR
jgi:hypothetical protein